MKLKLIFASLVVFGLSGPATADSHDTTGAAAGDRPVRGMTEQSVEARFGEPSSRVAPVGEPPIARWEYPGFIVYFEYDRVIHSVTKRQ
ncbi:MAG: hypothetical protein V2I25_01920 [Woeseiaceae bacterium]|jgi:hypothetical protein|nr:hypothetical protein [Woeseiaceae bacterium]